MKNVSPKRLVPGDVVFSDPWYMRRVKHVQLVLWVRQDGPISHPYHSITLLADNTICHHVYEGHFSEGHVLRLAAGGGIHTKRLEHERQSGKPKAG